MFIDGEQVTALYNAVAKPEYESGTLTISLKKLSSGKIEGEGAVEAELGVASWLKRIFPFLDAKVKGGLKAAVGGERGCACNLREGAIFLHGIVSAIASSNIRRCTTKVVATRYRVTRRQTGFVVPTFMCAAYNMWYPTVKEIRCPLHKG